MTRLIRLGVKVYQWVFSPAIHMLMGPQAGCRYTPTCSVYFEQAVKEHGVFRGSLMGIRRICTCNPFYRGGFDPIKPRVSSGTQNSQRI